MNMTMKEYDSMLAVACIVLAVVLNALQISYIADGLVMASQQGYIMAPSLRLSSQADSSIACLQVIAYG